MGIKTDRDITGQKARDIRLGLGMSQPEFWGPLGVKQTSASYYENGGRRIPPAVRSMLFIRYIAGIKHSPSTEGGARKLLELASNHQPEQGN